MEKANGTALASHYELKETILELVRAYGPLDFLEAVKSNCSGFNEAAFDQRLADVVRSVVCLLDDPDHPRLAFECLKLAAGFGSEPLEAIGTRFGLSKQAVSLRVLKYRDKLGLPPAGRGMSDRVRAKYRKTNGRRKGRK